VLHPLQLVEPLLIPAPFHELVPELNGANLYMIYVLDTLCNFAPMQVQADEIVCEERFQLVKLLFRKLGWSRSPDGTQHAMTYTSTSLIEGVAIEYGNAAGLSV